MNVDEREWFDGQVTTRFGRGSGTSSASRGTNAVVGGRRGTNSGASPRTPATTVTIGLVDDELENGESAREREGELGVEKGVRLWEGEGRSSVRERERAQRPFYRRG
jgi:hypothetical protein